jgi:4-hydroxy-tetrahydrodipicolinate reductase
MKKTIRIALIGCSGRMGQRIVALSEADTRFQLIAGVERPGSANVGRFIGGRAPVVDSVDEILSKTDAVIDFSAHDATIKNAIQVASMRKPLVIGTTGLKSAEAKKLRQISKRIPIVFSPNMSVGVNTLFHLVAEAARALASYDLEIIEAHHSQKKDAPSGTAMRLAEIAAQASGRSSKDFIYGRKGLIGARTKKEIGIMSVRAGDIVGDHTVLFSTGGERLELIHRAHSRDAFASGALEAAAWIVGKKPGLYSMLDVLKGKK